MGAEKFSEIYITLHYKFKAERDFAEGRREEKENGGKCEKRSRLSRAVEGL